MVITNCNNSNANYKSKFVNRSQEVTMRAALVQASWALIRKDGVMQGKYDRLKSGSGGKRAIYCPDPSHKNEKNAAEQ